jgi:DNA-directed RNA polymerase specialized sigma24 family protein
MSFFLKLGHTSEPEALSDAVLDTIARKPDSYPIRNVTEYAIGVARYVNLEHARRRSRVVPILEGQDFRDERPNPEEAALGGIDAERRRDCFRRCMGSLSADERWLILEYYPTENRGLEQRRRRIAAMLAIEPGALTSRMNRLRGKLVVCCAQCYAGGMAARE